MHIKLYARRSQRPRRPVGGAREPETLTSQNRPAAVGLAPSPAMSPQALLGLQRAAGNRNVARLLARQRDPAPPVALIPGRPHEQAVLTWPLRRARPGLLQRIEIPAGEAAPLDWVEVPRQRRARVRAAVAILNDKIRSQRLITYFRDNAPGGTLNTLQQVANRARVWELPDEGSLGMAFVGGRDMAYDTLIYRIGRWQIAATLLHEMGHLASFPTEAQCEGAIDAGRVYAPFIQSVQPRQAAPGQQVTISGMSFGPRQETTDRITFGGTDAGRATAWEWQHAGGGRIRVQVPTGAVSGPVVVENNRIPSNTIPFQVNTPAP